jgi:hypothetical protein
MKDGALLVTSACLLVLAHRRLAAVANRKLQKPAPWVIQGWSIFICLNIFVAVASHTVLFWSLLYTGKGTSDNYTQWKIKRQLMKECEAPGQAVLLGASQSRTQIDTKVLNESLGAKLWTTELHFPASSPYDMMLCLERVPDVRLDYVIFYASEATFHAGTDNSRFTYFFGFRDLPQYISFGSNQPRADKYFISGLLGDIVPVYRIWDPLLARLKGFESVNRQQAVRDASLTVDLYQRARDVRASFSGGSECEFKKRAFVTLARMCRQRGARFVVCSGKVNPILQRELPTAIRSDMLAFLHGQARADTNIVLLEEEEMPVQAESDYEDLTHVTKAARARFSEYVANKLMKLAPAHPTPATR